MPPPLLTTKLYIPAIPPRWVPRPVLVERLRAGLERRLTLVSAPAGFGKTTLVAAWARGLAVPCAWLSLDAGDNDPARFLAYVAAALHGADASVGQAAQGMLAAPELPPAEAVLTSLINDLASTSGPLVMVLDDYHVIETLPIHDQLAFVLDHQPPQLHLAIVSREDPPLPLSRLRARGHLIEVRRRDLQFTAAEAAEFVRGTMALDLSEDDVEALHQRTEGWVAGLQLAALSIRDSDDAQQLVRSLDGSHRYILDYLIDEVFERQAPGVQQFLLETSILERFGAGLCDAVTGRGDARQVLLSLEHANLFLVALDASRAWYRYHRLFGDLLRHRAQVALKARLPDLHRRASIWYAEHGYAVDAVHHALEAGDWEGAADLIASGASTDLLARGEVRTLLQWCRTLPEEVVQHHSGVSLEYAWALILSEQAEAAEPYLDRVEQALQQEQNAALAGGVAVARVHIARVRGDHRAAMALAERALAVLPKDDLSSRSVLAINLGIAQWYAGRLSSAELTLAEAQRAGQGSHNDYVYLAARIFGTRVCAARGRLRRAAATYREIIDGGEGHPIVALAHLDLARLCYEWDDLSSAVAHARRGIALGRRSGSSELLAAGCSTLGFVTSQDTAAGATEAMEEANRLVERPGLSAAAHLHNLVARLHVALARGDVETARAVSERAPRPEEAGSFPDYLALHLAQVRLLLAQGQLLQAEEEAAGLQARAAAAGWAHTALVASVLRALATRAADTRRDRLAAALALAEPEGYVRTFVDLGAPMMRALRQVAAEGVASDYVAGLLAAFSHVEAPPDEVLPSETALLEPLSEREREVLQLLVSGGTYQEIALAISVSLNTVKTHLKHIYAKLGVNDRRAATTRARCLGLDRQA